MCKFCCVWGGGGQLTEVLIEKRRYRELTMCRVKKRLGSLSHGLTFLRKSHLPFRSIQIYSLSLTHTCSLAYFSYVKSDDTQFTHTHTHTFFFYVDTHALCLSLSLSIAQTNANQKLHLNKHNCKSFPKDFELLQNF